LVHRRQIPDVARPRRGRGLPEGFAIGRQRLVVGRRPTLAGRLLDAIAGFGG
jgi:hypothetical protein